jgi:hypothetical protein
MSKVLDGGGQAGGRLQLLYIHKNVVSVDEFLDFAQFPVA